MAINVETLADEILLSILQAIRNVSTASALLPSLLTCRRWYKVGTTILYQDIVLENKTIRKSIEPLRKYSNRVRAVSIKLYPIEVEMYTPKGQPNRLPVGDVKKLRLEGSLETQTLWKDLEEVAVAISEMESLSTLSVKVDAEPGEAFRPGFWLHLRSFDILLKSLPASLIHLEVDLAFRDTPGNGGPMHLCPTIRLLLPQLKELRLRLRTVCKALLNTPLRASNLENFVMNTNDYITRTSTCMPIEDFDFNKLVDYPQIFLHQDNTTTAPRVEVMGSSETESYWTTTCSELLEEGCFPVIQRLDVFDFEQARFFEGNEIDKFEEDERGLDPEAYQADHWNHHEVLTRKTFRFPVKRVGGPRGSMLRSREHGEEFGDQRPIEQRVEGPAWVETVGGVRFPASFAASGTALRQHYLWQDLELDSRQDFERRSKYGLEIWDAEEKEGVWLVDVEEFDHF